MNELRRHLDTLVREVPTSHRLERDPVRFARRYDDPRDQEVAGFLAAGLAYGRVASFGPVLDELFALADRRGGPRRWVETFEPTRDPQLSELVYRWNRGSDYLLLIPALSALIRSHGSIGAAVVVRPGERDVSHALSRMVREVRESIPDPRPWKGLPRGVRYHLVDPADGSASKRLLMFTRWMVRSPDDGVDLGLWPHIRPDQLLIPVDTHVHRIARLTGLITRKTADLRASFELTASLARFCPSDPVRYDFALAHLGISGGCRGIPLVPICPYCPLQSVCIEGMHVTMPS